MLIYRNQVTKLIRFSWIMVVLVLVASAWGILDQSIYKPMTPDAFLPGTLSQDILSLISALLLAITLLKLGEGSDKAWLVWAGLLFYFFYAYGLYCYEAVYNHLFLVYLAILGLCIALLIGFFASLNTGRFRQTHAVTFPRKTIGVYFIFLVILFGVLWLSVILPAMRDKLRPQGQTIYVFDLTMVLPLLAFTAYRLFKQDTLADILTPIILVKMASLGLSVLLGELLRPFFAQELNMGGILIFAILGGGGLILSIWTFSRITVISER